MRSWSVCAVVIAFLLVLGQIFGVESKSKKVEKKAKPKINISLETTSIEKPLTKDGYVDYLQALNDRFSKGVTFENNAAVAIWQAIGPDSPDFSDDLRDEVFKRLGITKWPEKGDYYVSLMKIAEQEAARRKPPGNAQELVKTYYDQMSKATAKPWSKKEFPALAKWITANEKPLAVLAKGVQREKYFVPMMASDDSQMLIAVLLPTVQSSRELARVLKTRAMFCLKAGDVEGAWRDLLTCHRLARHVGQGPTLIESLVCIAIDSMACQGDVALAHHGSPMTEQAKKIRAEIEKLPPLPMSAECLDVTERFMFLDCVTHLARGTDKTLEALGVGGDGAGAALTKLLAKSAVDWNEPMKIGNQWYDRLVAAARKPTYAERSKAMEGIDEDIKKLVMKSRDAKSLAAAVLLSSSPRKAIGRRVGAIMVALLLPAVQAVTVAEDRAHTTVDLTRVVLALSAYRNDHGEYPKTLDVLAPKYIAELPKDIVVDAPFRYKVEEGGYLLYSVGKNKTDDNGNGPFSESREGDDLAFRTPKPKK